MSILKNNKVIAVGDVNTYHPPILSCMWSDHIINDIQWLRADTFSWQDGTVYATIYDKLVEEYATGTTVTESSITFKRTTNDFKIADTSQESNILNKYNTGGIAWYYIIDTENRRFKLPRMKHKYWKDANTLGVKGNGISLGLTGSNNINYGLCASNASTISAAQSQYGIAPYTGSKTNYHPTALGFGLTTNSSKSGIVADVSNSVEETGFYLYFYVGEYSQTALEQTAGLNSELFNGKLDINASGLSTQGKSYVSGLGMPSSRYIDLTLGATGSSYTAPANGWFYINKAATDNQIFAFQVDGVICGKFGSWAGSTIGGIAPAKKGSTVYVFYSASGTTNSFRFYYAEGSNN